MARWWRRGAQAPTATPAPPARESAPPPAPPHSAPVQRAEWRDVPPLRPVVAAISPVAPSDTFVQTLAAWQNPSFLQPLAHAVDPAGPAGHVDGLAVPAAPRMVSGAAFLPVADRPPGRTATVQRAAGPWLGFAERPAALGTDTDSEEPAPGNGFAADGWEEPRTLSVAPAPPSGGTLTVAPELPVRSTLPAVPRPSASSSPSAAPGTPTVSRSMADDGHSGNPTETRAASAARELPPAADAADHLAPDTDEHGPAAVSAAAGEAPQAAADPGIAPLIGDPVVSPTGMTNSVHDGVADNDHSTTDLADTSSETAMPLAAVSPGPSTVQRSAADRTHRAPGLGAPLPTAPAAPPVQRTSARDADVLLPPVQRAGASPVPPSRSSAPPGLPTSAVRPSAAQHHLETPVEQSGDVASSWATAPLVGSAHLMRAIDSADSGAEAGGAAGADGQAGMPATTLPTASSSGVPSPSPLLPSSLRPVHGSPPAMDVQRTVGDDLSSEGVRPAAELITEEADGLVESAKGTTPASTAVAPTLGVSAGRRVVEPQQESFGDHHDSSIQLPVATRLAPEPAGVAPHLQRSPELPAMAGHVTDEPSPTTSPHQDPPPTETHPVASASAQPAADEVPVRLSPLLGERAAPQLALGTLIGPAVQRFAAPGARGGQAHPDRQPRPSSGSGSGAATSVHATGFASAGVAVQRSQSAPPAAGARPGLGAAMPTIPASIGPDAVSVRAMSLEQMFSPGAAAIASGAAHSDGTGSVVFHAPTVDQPAEWPSVQRFGLPGADVLSGASSLADRARNAGGGLVNSARGAANSYADSARNAVGGHADSARNAAGGYADAARNAVGGYADTARTLAGGYADSARGAAGSAVNAAETAVGDAAGAARGVAGQAVDSVQSAAGGVAGAAQNAVATAAGAAGGAVAGAAGAAANALPTDLDELARRLFDPLSARLKSELWLDRERAGMVTDLRR